MLDQLLGEGTYAAGIAAGPEQGAGLENEVVVFNWPSPPEERQAYQGSEHVCTVGHIEGYRGAHKGGPTTKWMVGATFYLTDVEAEGGGTYFWPGSCHSVHRYFQRYPEDIPDGGALCTSVGWQRASRRS